MWNRHLFIDMNSFFASVEQQDRPELRGKPVIVVPMDADTTCAIAASYEAKAFGVKTLTGVGDAKRMCPELQVIEARPALYQRYHQRIVEVLNEHFVGIKVLSVDEMACRIGRWHSGTVEGSALTPQPPLGPSKQCRDRELFPRTGEEESIARREAEGRLARRVKEDLYREIGECMKCSIGIADNVFLAKVATEMEKPDGLTILDESNFPQALFGLGLRDFPGIGPSMHARLLKSGIRTVEELWNLSRAELRRVWGGIGGDRWWHMMRGSREVDYEANVREERKSVGHSHVLPPQFRSLEGSRGILLRLISRALKRLRAYGLAGRSVHLHVSFMKMRMAEYEYDYEYESNVKTESHAKSQRRKDSRGSWGAHCSVAIHANDDITWMAAVRRALDSMEIPRGYFPLKVGATFTDLISCENANLSLFDDRAKRARLFETVDVLNELFGHVVDLASVYWLREEAPYRIAFGASLLDAVR